MAAWDVDMEACLHPLVICGLVNEAAHRRYTNLLTTRHKFTTDTLSKAGVIKRVVVGVSAAALCGCPLSLCNSPQKA